MFVGRFDSNLVCCCSTWLFLLLLPQGQLIDSDGEGGKKWASPMSSRRGRDSYKSGGGWRIFLRVPQDVRAGLLAPIVFYAMSAGYIRFFGSQIRF